VSLAVALGTLQLTDLGSDPRRRARSSEDRRNTITQIPICENDHLVAFA
jgi:hypothetical protein